MYLTSSRDELPPDGEVTFEIAGLQPHADGGSYIARWIINPPGSLRPTGEDIIQHDADGYSVHDAAEPVGPARATFEVREAARPVTVTADVRYRRDQVQLGRAHEMHAGRAATAQLTLRAAGPQLEAVRSSPGAPAGQPPATPTGPAVGGPGAGDGNGTPPPPPVAVTLQRAAVDSTPTQALWTLIRQSASALSFQNYQAFMDQVLCTEPDGNGPSALYRERTQSPRHMVHRLPWRLPFPGVEPYRQLKAATEVFVMLNCGVPFDQFMTAPKSSPGDPLLSPTQQWSPDRVNVNAEMQRESARYGRPVSPGQIRQAWLDLLAEGHSVGGVSDPFDTILYLALVRANLSDARVMSSGLDLSPQAVQELEHGAANCMAILQEKLVNPCFIELLWSYWQEEAGLVQTINAITWRFQNRRGAGDRDPLASLEIDPLRPLNNFLWGYIQDEEHRLSVVRRAYEYAHHYGLVMLGRAVPEIRSADTRSRFVESLHNLLHLCSVFYKEDDDTTMLADGFPLLNALKEVHLLLTQGAANQYGDLPWTARLEMLMQQWLLARPELRGFLPSRTMVDYPEEWMSSVEAMKTVQGWSSASVLHFRDLAVFGEQIVLSIRFQAWPSVIEAQHAANWARYWRPEIQGYIYAYRAVTGVDVTERPDATAPGLLLRQRMRQSLPAARAGLAGPRPPAQLPAPGQVAERGRR